MNFFKLKSDRAAVSIDSSDSPPNPQKTNTLRREADVSRSLGNSVHLKVDGINRKNISPVGPRDSLHEDDEVYHDALEFQDGPVQNISMDDNDEFYDALDYCDDLKAEVDSDLEDLSDFQEISPDEARQSFQDLDQIPGRKYDFEGLTEGIGWKQKIVMGGAMKAMGISKEQINGLLGSFSHLNSREQNDFFALANSLEMGERVGVAKMMINSGLTQDEHVTILKLMVHNALEPGTQSDLAKAMVEFDAKERKEIFKFLGNPNIPEGKKVGQLPIMANKDLSKDMRLSFVRKLEDSHKSEQSQGESLSHNIPARSFKSDHKNGLNGNTLVVEPLIKRTPSRKGLKMA